MRCWGGLVSCQVVKYLFQSSEETMLLSKYPLLIVCRKVTGRKCSFFGLTVVFRNLNTFLAASNSVILRHFSDFFRPTFVKFNT